MRKNTKLALVKLLGGLGLIALLVGWLTQLYDVLTGVVIALTFWILSGVVATFLGVKKKKK